MTVEQILKSKSANEIFAVPSSISVFDAIKIMGAKDIGAILVIDDEKLVGILSERDYARRIVAEDIKPKKTLVKDIMASKLVTVAPTDDLDLCMELMTTRRIRHIPVLENDKVIGIVSVGDVVNVIIAKQKETIKLLDSYISGS